MNASTLKIITFLVIISLIKLMRMSIMVIVSYGNNKTEKLCCDSKKAKKELGLDVSEKLFAAINIIESATSLNDIACIPRYRLHGLEGDRKGSFAMDLGRKLGYRLIIKPDPPFTEEENKLDFNSKCSVVKCIIVLEVSNHYE